MADLTMKDLIRLANTNVVEEMCRAWWNRHANIPWDECPEHWKPFYRESMQAAIDALEQLKP